MWPAGPPKASSSLAVLPSLLPTSLEQAGPPLQAAVPALMPELELTFQQTQVGRVPQGLRQARLPPAELLLSSGQLQQVALLQVGPALCWGCRSAQPWEGRQDLPPSQAAEGRRRETGEPRGRERARRGMTIPLGQVTKRGSVGRAPSWDLRLLPLGAAGRPTVGMSP